jgi:hypothetical protein
LGNPVHRIGLQIEHTLVKPGGRGSENSPIGKIPIPGDAFSNNYLVRIAQFERLSSQDYVIEYSRSNFKNIKTSGYYPSITIEDDTNCTYTLSNF